ncbi:hypothetical protein K438DRAFT_1753829 [Mycena galopus ATCC 62051]|nr:hypothetical protein K438DRAFT_1753829 [Mycena galopus ATCC 62051]
MQIVLEVFRTEIMQVTNSDTFLLVGQGVDKTRKVTFWMECIQFVHKESKIASITVCWHLSGGGWQLLLESWQGQKDTIQSKERGKHRSVSSLGLSEGHGKEFHCAGRDWYNSGQTKGLGPEFQIEAVPISASLAFSLPSPYALYLFSLCFVPPQILHTPSSTLPARIRRLKHLDSLALDPEKASTVCWTWIIIARDSGASIGTEFGHGLCKSGVPLLQAQQGSGRPIRYGVRKNSANHLSCPFASEYVSSRPEG